jgi:Type III restriction enzyme, res subunit
MANTTTLKLEDRLILFGFFNDLFGAAKFADLQAALKDTSESYDEEGFSHFYNGLRSRAILKVAPDLLKTCDENIRGDLAAINRGRSEPIRLKYFQYLAALYTELFLYWRANDRAAFVQRLNAFVSRANVGLAYGAPRFSPFKPGDLDKIAYWMATGSGKTLLLHLNYHQFFRYNPARLDNLLLITPNERLSDQHLQELELSRVPAARFGDGSVSPFSDPRLARVIEITKFTEKKTGAGVSVDVAAFEGSNLVFVDEGHKGAGGDAWKSYRDQLGAGGFTFEYSATFGQAINIVQDSDLLNEYSKSIIFDYSYKYFYGDGFGKEYAILNLKDEDAPDLTDTLLLGNLLSFYEQARCFADRRAALKAYHLEPPLWIFVGSSVNAVYTENREKKSDVLTVVLFLRRALKNEGGWTTRTLDAILKGKSQLKDDDHDIFDGQFGYIRDELQLSAAALFKDLLATVFHVDHATDLHVSELKEAEGEIGLKAGDSETYFGVINIGDVSAFFKLLELEHVDRDAGDTFTRSLFEQINTPESKVNVLIGSKKFIEGWSSWRVSSMGLLNMGRGEGSQIIQLFGRGVRLLGKARSLKRSTALPGPHPAHLPLLETLNIFGIRADYMLTFRNYLEREGVDVDNVTEIKLPIAPNEDFLKNGLLEPRLQNEWDFAEHIFMPLAQDDEITVKLDLRPQLQLVQSQSTATGILSAADEPRRIPRNLLPLLDWDRLYFAMLDYKAQKEWSNLVIAKATLRQILEAERYELYCADAELTLSSFGDLARIEAMALGLLKKYAEAFYKRRREQAEMEKLEYRVLNPSEKKGNFQDYTVKVRRSQPAIIKQIRALAKAGSELYTHDTTIPPNVHFDRHLYQPLLTAQQEPNIKSVPPGLNDGERQFVEDLRSYCAKNPAALKGKQLFLLRNLSRGKGIGFFEGAGFYPDFILWIKAGKHQQITFIDPKGIRNLGNFSDPKIQLYLRIKDIEKQLGRTSVSLESFIISVTAYEDLKKTFGEGGHSREDFTKHHVLFQDGTYIQTLFEMLEAEQPV